VDGDVIPAIGDYWFQGGLAIAIDRYTGTGAY